MTDNAPVSLAGWTLALGEASSETPEPSASPSTAARISAPPCSRQSLSHRLVRRPRRPRRGRSGGSLRPAFRGRLLRRPRDALSDRRRRTGAVERQFVDLPPVAKRPAPARHGRLSLRAGLSRVEEAPDPASRREPRLPAARRPVAASDVDPSAPARLGRRDPDARARLRRRGAGRRRRARRRAGGLGSFSSARSTGAALRWRRSTPCCGSTVRRTRWRAGSSAKPIAAAAVVVDVLAAQSRNSTISPPTTPPCLSTRRRRRATCWTASSPAARSTAGSTRS